MRQRTLVVLAAVAVLGALYLLLLPPRARAPAGPPRVFDPGRAPIQRIGLAPRGLPGIELSAVGGVVLILPARLPADPAAFAAMVNAAELLTVRRRLSAARPEYGLAPPRMQITIAGQTVALGADTADGQGTYAAAGARVFVVDRELAAPFLRPVAQPRIFALSAEAPARLQISLSGRDGSELVVERDVNRRAFVTPRAAGRRRADYTAAQTLLGRLGELRTVAAASAGTTGSSGSPGATGAATPASPTGAAGADAAVDVSAETPAPPPGLRIELAGVVLTTLGPCSGRAGATSARIERTGLPGETTCLTGDVLPLLGNLADLAALADLLTDRALFDIPPDDVAEARVTVGARTLILRRSGGGFHVIPGGARAPFDADSDTVAEWLDGLFAARAADLEPVGARHFEAAPSITLTTASAISERVQLDGDRAHRDDEDIMLRLTAPATSWFDADPVRFRDREIVSFNATDLREVKRTLAGHAAERIQRDPSNAEAYIGVTPAGPVDPGAALALRDALANLRAVRWTSQAAGQGSGMSPPRARIEATLAEPGGARSIVIELGADAPEGCFARRTAPPDPDLFILDPARCQALTAPLHAP